MQSLMVTARLANGFATLDPWSPSLDGILAAAVMLERLGDDYAISAAAPSRMTPVEGLPLERIDHGGMWWYACSLPILPSDEKERRHIHRRFDETEAAARVPDVRRVQDRAGPFKAARIELLRRVVASVVWHAVGEPAEIRRLLGSVPAIGARRAAGYGEVVHWDVVPGTAETMELAHRHRPLPVAYAQEIGATGLAVLAAIRPPARLPCNNVECIVPHAA